MRVTSSSALFVGAVFSVLTFIPLEGGFDPPRPLPPLPPDTSATVPDAPTHDLAAVAANVEATLHPESFYPVRITIPSIRVNSPIMNVGVNSQGEMDVPDGSTKYVGWYKYGTVPGRAGSAVMDAHVYAAFKKLKNVGIGSDIYVENAKGETLHFRVIASKAYPLSQVPMDTIFSDSSGTFLNLITCEGKYSVRSNTYSHRRVVYAQLVEG